MHHLRRRDVHTIQPELAAASNEVRVADEQRREAVTIQERLQGMIAVLGDLTLTAPRGRNGDDEHPAGDRSVFSPR